MSVEVAFLTVARAGLAQIEANLPGVMRSRDPEFIHQMRVGMRRLRSTFIAFRAAIPSAVSSGIRCELRGATQALGAARDWDVLCESLSEACRTRFPERASLEALLRHAALRRSVSLRRARRAVDAVKFRGALLRARRWLTSLRWREKIPVEILTAPVAPLARRALKRLFRKALACGENAAALRDDDLHQLRIRIKRLRYACEFFASLYPPKRARLFLRQLQRLQDTLGELNDLAVAERLLDAVSAATPDVRPATARLRVRRQRSERRLLTHLGTQWDSLRAADLFW
jgi:CHAD domain-containing protein